MSFAVKLHTLIKSAMQRGSVMDIYVVTQGDTVDSISQRFGVTSDSVIYNNQLVYPYRLAIGQSLLIGTTDTAAGGTKRIISTNGYAYPFISPWVLGQTLPYLTELSIFSYGFTENGQLIAPILDDTWMTQEARALRTFPFLTLTPLGADGRFNNNLISAVVHSQEAIRRLILSLAEVMVQKGYEGLDIDFEYIKAEDRDAFSEFVRIMTTVMNAFGYEVSVALAPKTSDDQQGLLYEGKDYAALGAAANHVLLMTYEWGYTYSEPRAVAPVNLVRQVVEYAVTVIPPEKIMLGIPNYGYDWALPFERGVTRAYTIGNVEAVQRAIRYGAEILYDEIARTPHYNYTDENGIDHEVWFEDARSMRAKYALIGEFGLRGIGCWQIMQLFRAMWLLLADDFWIRKAPELGGA